MNPLTNVKNIQKLNQRELELGVIGKKSWHDEYKDSAWVFIGGLPYDLTEGDIVCVFSQYGEIVNINLVRDKATGKSKGFAFLCYEDQRSTVLAVDNLNSIKLLGRIIRVDHVSDYKKPKEKGDEDEITLQLRAEGCAPKAPSQTQLPSLELLEEPPTIRPPSSTVKTKKEKKAKKDKKKKKKKKKMKVTVKVEQKSESESSSESSDSEDDDSHRRRKTYSPGTTAEFSQKMKQEKRDAGYDRAVHGHRKPFDQSGERGYDRKRDHSETEARGRSGDTYRDSSTNERFKQEPSDRNKDRNEGSRRDERRDRDEKLHSRNERDYDDRRDRDRDDRRDRDQEDRRDRDSSRNDRKERYRDRDDYHKRR